MEDQRDNSVNVEDVTKNITQKPHPTDFDMFLPWACKEFCIETKIIVNRVFQKIYISAGTSNKKLNKKRLQSKIRASSISIDVDSDDGLESTLTEEDVTNPEDVVITVESLYDSNENLVQLKFLNNRALPRKVMQIVGMTIPYQKYLTLITINKGLRMDSLYEISKFLPDSQITELCLDSTFVSEANYHILLTHGKLKHLSLAKCSINDAIVKTITNQLVEPCPASKVLSALNLSSNKITDIGAKYFADVLRTNRQLSYLNLADNMITDKGGISILDTLQKFPLHHDEILASRARYVAYLREKNDLIERLILELQTIKCDKSVKNKIIKKGMSLLHVSTEKRNELGSDAQIIKEKAECLAATRMGLFNEAFVSSNTVTQNGVVHCFGNNTLCCLNLAYNSLTFASVKKLHEVITTQNYFLNRTPRGLIKVVIEGNLMPVACEEYREIDHLIGLGSVGFKRQSEAVIKLKHFNVKSTKR